MDVTSVVFRDWRASMDCSTLHGLVIARILPSATVEAWLLVSFYSSDTKNYEYPACHHSEELFHVIGYSNYYYMSNVKNTR